MKLALPQPGRPKPCADQIHVEKIDSSVCRSTAGAYSWLGEGIVQGGIRAQAYGGYVYTQSVWAVLKTVGKDFTVHVRSLFRRMWLPSGRYEG